MKNLRSFILSTLVLFVFLSLAPRLDVKASEVDVASIVANLTGSDVPGNLSVYPEGISASHSGYAIYLIDKNGVGKSPNAKLVTSTSTNYFGTGSNYMWGIKTKLGGYTVAKGSATAMQGVDWGAPIDLSSGWGSRQNEIREYMATQVDVGGVTKVNAWKVISTLWGVSVADQWATNDWQLVLEPIYVFKGWFQYNLTVNYNGTDIFSGVFKTCEGAPYFVGNVYGLASMMNTYIPFYASSHNKIIDNYPMRFTYKYATSLSSSPMSSGYQKGLCHTIELSAPVGSLGVCSLPSSSYLSLAQIKNLGVGICAFSSSALTGEAPPVPAPVTPKADGTYEGYIYTLSASANAGNTTEASLLQGALDLANPA